MKTQISREVCPCCDKEVDMIIESDDDYEWSNGKPLIFRRCPECGSEMIDPKRNPDNVAIREKEKYEKE